MTAPKKILLLGKNGQLGTELQRSLAPLGELVALERQATHYYCGDLSNLAGLAQTLKTLAPDIIVNAAAYTAVDAAESDSEQAQLVNATAVALLAEHAQKHQALLVHYSTDYVFNGSGTTPWSESDTPDPINTYGKTKLAGEVAIINSGCNYLLFRTSWVYSARHNNFANTILRRARDHKDLRVVTDQYGAPTSAELIARVTTSAIKAVLKQPELMGLYHLAAKGEINWYGYAVHILAYAENMGIPLKTTSKTLQPVTSDGYSTPAKRPKNSRLNTHKLEAAFDIQLPEWQTGLARALSEIVYQTQSEVI